MIDVYADAEALSQAAAALFADEARKSVAASDRFSISLAGGQTPRRVYEILAQAPYRDGIPWSRVHVFWGDERCVPAEDSRSNARMARQALLDHVPIPAEQVHPVPFAATPAESAAQYAVTLRTFFSGAEPRFDLVLLGLGENGHTASLFPNTPVLSDRQRWVAEVYVQEQNLWRITMTAVLLNEAAVAAFLVTGANKADVVREVVEGPRDAARLPAQLIQLTHGELRWLLDRGAASKLQAPPGY